MAMNKKGLGRGLNALITSEQKVESIVSDSSSSVAEIDINKIEPNKHQPRKMFNEELIQELAESIKEFGIIQPIIVTEEKGFYTIVAGERRFRAARIAKLRTIPAIIRDYDEMEIMQVALIENIQRENLNPIEEALCYKKLVEYFFYKKEDIAKKVGKSRNTISSMMSLLMLDPRVQNFIVEGRLLIGQARKLLEVKNNDIQFEIADKIIDNELSIRETEKLIQEYLKSQENRNNLPKKGNDSINDYKNIETTLKEILGTKVIIRDKNNKGKIEIEYYSEEELDRLLYIFKNIEMGD